MVIINLEVHVVIPVEPDYWGLCRDKDTAKIAAEIQSKTITEWIRSAWPKASIETSLEGSEPRVTVRGPCKRSDMDTVAAEIYAQFENTWLEPASQAIIQFERSKASKV